MEGSFTRPWPPTPAHTAYGKATNNSVLQLQAPLGRPSDSHLPRPMSEIECSHVSCCRQIRGTIPLAVLETAFLPLAFHPTFPVHKGMKTQAKPPARCDLLSRCDRALSAFVPGSTLGSFLLQADLLSHMRPHATPFQGAVIDEIYPRQNLPKSIHTY